MMLKVNALCFLLLIEFLVILLVSVVYLFLKNRSQRTLNMKILKKFVEAKSTIDELETLKAEEVQKPKADEELQSPQGVDVDENKYFEILKERDELITKMKEFEDKYFEISRERDELITKVKESEDKLQEKTSLLDEMEKRYKRKEKEYAALEKEYLILYNRQEGEGV